MTVGPPRVGVVIPTFERTAETVRAVHSALSQSHVPSQVIVVDDGSTADVQAELQEQLRGLVGVELLRARHTGHPGRVRNVGVGHLNDAEWIAFLDSDDEWYPQKLERQLAFARESRSVAICSNADRVVDGAVLGRVHERWPERLSLAALVEANVIINSSVLLRREVLAAVGGVAESYVVRGTEDYATWLRIATTHAWGVVDEPLLAYTDMPAASIRGTEGASHPGQWAAWLDFLAWCRDSDAELSVSERVIGSVLRRTLQYEGSRVAGRRRLSGQPPQAV